MKLEICTVSKNVDHTCNFAMSWYFATSFHENWWNSIIRTTYKLQLIFFLQFLLNNSEFRINSNVMNEKKIET